MFERLRQEDCQGVPDQSGLQKSCLARRKLGGRESRGRWEGEKEDDLAYPHFLSRKEREKAGHGKPTHAQKILSIGEVA